MDKKYFLRLGMILCLCLCFVCGVSIAQEDREALAITHGPYLQNPTENAMTIIWFTNKKCVSRVEFGQDKDLSNTAQNSQHGLIDAFTTIHKVRVKGLTPGTQYSYRVVSKEITQFNPYEVLFGETITSNIHSFYTLDKNKQEFSFLVFNDIHEQGKVLDRRLQTILWEGVDLVFLNGDIISHFEDEEQIFAGFLDTCVKHFASRIPFIWIRGNHETRGHMARSLPKYLDTPEGLFYYSFNQGPAHFVIMDTGEDKEDTHSVYAGLVDFDRYRDLQAEWLKQEIKTKAFKKAPFKLVLFHIPPYGGKGRHGEMYVQTAWGPILNRAKIDLLISAHFHRFIAIEPTTDQNRYPILVGGTGTIIRADVTKKKMDIVVTDAKGGILHSMLIRNR